MLEESKVFGRLETRQSEILEEVHKVIAGILTSETSIGEPGAKLVASRIVWKYLAYRWRLSHNKMYANGKQYFREWYTSQLVPLPDFIG